MKLNEGVHVVVGTPGRVHDMINRKALNPNSIKLFVLDEADEMLSRGFKDQIYNVFKYMPSDTQVNYDVEDVLVAPGFGRGQILCVSWVDQVSLHPPKTHREPTPGSSAPNHMVSLGAQTQV